MFADPSKLEAVEKVRNKLHRWIIHEWMLCVGTLQFYSWVDRVWKTDLLRLQEFMTCHAASLLSGWDWIFVVINEIGFVGWQKLVTKAEGAVNDTTVKIFEADSVAMDTYSCLWNRLLAS